MPYFQVLPNDDIPFLPEIGHLAVVSRCVEYDVVALIRFAVDDIRRAGDGSVHRSILLVKYLSILAEACRCKVFYTSDSVIYLSDKAMAASAASKLHHAVAISALVNERRIL